MRKTFRCALLQDIHDEHKKKEQCEWHQDANSNLPASKRKPKDGGRDEEECADDVKDSEPPVPGSCLAHETSTAERDGTHGRNDKPDENACEVEEEMSKRHLNRNKRDRSNIKNEQRIDSSACIKQHIR